VAQGVGPKFKSQHHKNGRKEGRKDGRKKGFKICCKVELIMTSTYLSDGNVAS
jgi:hypothetical protein